MDRREAYHKRVGDTPNLLVIHALKNYVTGRRASLDLGAGNLRDSKFLLSKGFARVVAVDQSEDSLAFSVPGVELHIAPIQTWKPEEGSFDFAFSCNTLFFLSREQTVNVFQNVLNGLRSGGIFACNVLGEKDSLIRPGWSCVFTVERLISICEGFEVLGLGEFITLGSSLGLDGSSGPRTVHQRAVILKKP